LSLPLAPFLPPVCSLLASDTGRAALRRAQVFGDETGAMWRPVAGEAPLFAHMAGGSATWQLQGSTWRPAQQNIAAPMNQRCLFPANCARVFPAALVSLVPNAMLICKIAAAKEIFNLQFKSVLI
jgi:hypothetical protein